jgi:hypothetical protein
MNPPSRTRDTATHEVGLGILTEPFVDLGFLIRDLRFKNSINNPKSAINNQKSPPWDTPPYHVPKVQGPNARFGCKGRSISPGP